MSRRILDSMGVNTEEVLRSVGASQTNARSSGNNSTNVYYVAISHEDMMSFRQFYEQDETDVQNANDIKDFHSLNDSVVFFFGETLLEEEKYAFRDALNAVMSKARAWHDMYGFVAVFNPDARAERKIRELDNEGEEKIGRTNAQLSRKFSSALDMPDLLVAEANRLITDAMPENETETRRRIIDGDVKVDGDEVETDFRNKRRRTAVTITDNPRHSAIRNPGAVMNFNPDNRNEELGRVGISEIEFQRAKAREQINNTSSIVDETLIKLRNLHVVDLEDGRFYLEVDPVNSTKRVVFVRSASAGRTQPTGNQTTRQDALEYSASGTAMYIDPDVFVFEWPNRTPYLDGRLNSKFYEVIRRRQALDQADRNVADVDLTNSHPIQMFAHAPPTNKADVERMTDAQLYGAGASVDNADSRTEIGRQAVQTYQLRVAAAMANRHNSNQLAQLIKTHKLGDTVLDANGNQTFAAFRQLGFLPLPTGFTPVNATKAEVTADTEMLAYRFRRALCNALGVPMVLLDGGSSFSGRASKNSSGSVSSGASTATQAISDTRLSNAIIADRKSVLSPFVAGLWDIMYRDIDNKTLARVLNNAAKKTREESELNLAEMRVMKRKLQTIVDLAEISRIRSDLTTRRSEIVTSVARLRDLSSRVRKIVTMRYRFRVEFNSVAFIPQDVLANAQLAGAISKLEYANAIRANFGKPPLTQAQFDKNKEEELQEKTDGLEAEAKIQAKYNPKPAPAGGSSSNRPAAKRK